MNNSDYFTMDKPKKNKYDKLGSLKNITTNHFKDELQSEFNTTNSEKIFRKTLAIKPYNNTSIEANTPKS